MCIERGGLGMSMAKQFTFRLQFFGHVQQPRGKCVPNIVYPRTLNSRRFAHKFQ